MFPKTHRDLVLPKLELELEPYREILQKIAKPAWLLKCNEDGEVSSYHTHIRGFKPFVPENKPWPCCSKCKKPLYFICQINFADFASQVVPFNKGLFQFFYCWDCMPMPNNDFGIEIRWYPDFDLTSAKNIPQANCPHPEEEFNNYTSLAVDVVAFLSLPSTQDDISVPDDILFQADYSFTKGLYLEDKMISRVGGYAPWFQSISKEDYFCPVCGNPTEFILAIGSEDTDLVWYDSGYWYFFACLSTSDCRGLYNPLMDCHFY